MTEEEELKLQDFEEKLYNLLMELGKHCAQTGEKHVGDFVVRTLSKSTAKVANEKFASGESFLINFTNQFKEQYKNQSGVVVTLSLRNDSEEKEKLKEEFKDAVPEGTFIFDPPAKLQ